MSETVTPFDIARMFLGDQPQLFYLEIVARTLLIYVYALVLIRWVGGRGIAQMSTVEFLLVIALGSAVGDAMFYPQVPLFHAMLVITVVVLINKVLDKAIFRFRTAERILDGVTAEVVRDGVINIDTLARLNIGQSELFDSMRQRGIRNLGQVSRAYLESSGVFSFFLLDEGAVGLQIEPPWSVEPPVIFGPLTTLPSDAFTACCNCGFTASRRISNTPDQCTNCAHRSWTLARSATTASKDGAP